MNMLIIAAISGFIAVALGSFGAHSLDKLMDDYSKGIFQTAVQYQMFHSLALFAAGLLQLALEGEVRPQRRRPNRPGRQTNHRAQQYEFPDSCHRSVLRHELPSGPPTAGGPTNPSRVVKREADRKRRPRLPSREGQNHDAS